MLSTRIVLNLAATGVLFASLLTGCGKAALRNKTDKTPAPAVASNQCRITASVSQIRPIDTNGEGICKKVPCTARILVHTVLQCGSSFRNPVAAGQFIEASFAFSLAPTDTLFPELSRHLPGLGKGDRFDAVLESRPLLNDTIQYIIYDYTLQK
jgi:hypothetical protein